MEKYMWCRVRTIHISFSTVADGGLVVTNDIVLMGAPHQKTETGYFVVKFGGLDFRVLKICLNVSVMHKSLLTILKL